MLSTRGSRGRATEYRRFPSAAEAIRFAIEELPAQLLIGVVMEVGDDRFDHKALRALYDHDVYPLARV
jgi:Arc/MetJ-type ribon-helix-helix transcriptional regulator